jgi:hypothetical protein
MNLLHKDIRTTDSIYEPLLSDEVGTRIAGLKIVDETGSEDDLTNANIELVDQYREENDHNRQLSTGLARRAFSISIWATLA